jgi:ATP-dependent DNA helicase Q1
LNTPEEVEIVHELKEKESVWKEKSYFVSFSDLKKTAEEKKELRMNRDPKWYEGFSWDKEIEIANQSIFGNKEFRIKQREIINATKSKRDVIALIPTGGGKSLTFQISAVTEIGITVVIMPLLSLIED